MEHEHDPKHPEQSVDTTRRRLAKAGLAAPAVLGVLASLPVLGAPPMNARSLASSQAICPGPKAHRLNAAH